ncbi:metadherin a isoform X2 [Colossoma macropomum]|uniref:metadherin a isoform X2 n=1 Tax=Colossoma macropomum TaxID=42526 RepID=UPI0018649785|nr:metadherin a isoform X2 [Colossoma macropomum]
MAATWRAAALEQAELVSDRLRRLASSGLHFLHSEFGLDLGVNPELWPSWVILTATLIGLLVAVWWVVACGGAARRKRGTGTKESSVNVNVTVAATTATDSGKTPPAKTVKTEEPKKKSKKKAGEKKTQPNGKTAPEPREEIKVTQEVPKQAPVVAAAPAPPPPTEPPADKVDKAKKSKKKTKPEVKQSQSVSTTDGKEPDEGAWETKVSNREKRQQRRKDKGPGDDSGSPGGGSHVGQLTEQPVVSAPANTKKNKESLNSKAEKADKTEKAEKRVDMNAAAPPSWNPVNSGGWTEKLPPQVSASDSKKWSVGVKTSGHRNSEPLAWGQESEGSWTNMEGRIKTELNTVNFSMLGLNSSAGDPVVQSSADLGKWEAVRAVDLEWSGFNGLGAADPSSDWNAPTEVWGNYEEPKAETPAAQQTPVSQPPKLQDSEDEKEKGDPSGSGKSKRKKKKKKKPEDENAVSQVNAEGRPAPAESSAVKPRPHVPQEEPAKQNVMPPASQKKADQNWEQPKQVQKKKARRET